MPIADLLALSAIAKFQRKDRRAARPAYSKTYVVGGAIDESRLNAANVWLSQTVREGGVIAEILVVKALPIQYSPQPTHSGDGFTHQQSPAFRMSGSQVDGGQS